MTPIPAKIRQILEIDPFMAQCVQAGPDCDTRIEWEHALIFAGRQVQLPWAIIPACTFHHRGPGLDKRLNEFVALSCMNFDVLPPKYRVSFHQKFVYLKNHYESTISTSLRLRIGIRKTFLQKQGQI